MSDEHIARAKHKDDRSVSQVLSDGSLQPFEEHMNWERFDALTDEEVEATALSDPDNLPFTEEQAARMMRVPNVREIREKLGLSLEAFAERFALNPWQVKRWEAREE